MAFEIEEREHLQYFRYGVVGFPDLIRDEVNGIKLSHTTRYKKSYQVLFVSKILV